MATNSNTKGPTKLHPDCLLSTLYEDIDKTQPCIIYMGVGTHCNDFKGWNCSNNQQLPAFLHDWKLNNPTIPVKIILFDQATTGIPYIIANKSSFFADSFVRDMRYNNVYNSEYGLQVYSFAMNVDWINNKLDTKDNYDITELIISIVESVSKSNHLFFFHDFTGRNPTILEYGIKLLTDFDESRVCIDISRGRDLSYSIDFSEPENYPLIKLDGQYISWINPKWISLKKQQQLIEKFEDKSITVLESPYCNADMFDYYLFKHIVNNNRYIFNICKQVICIMESLYNKDSKFSDFGTNIMKLNILNVKIPYIQIFLSKAFIRVNQIQDKISSGICKNTVHLYKLSLLEDLKTIVGTCLSSIKTFSSFELSELFSAFDTLSDKSKLMNIFNDYCLTHNLLF
jgi:hypothetical protein